MRGAEPLCDLRGDLNRLRNRQNAIVQRAAERHALVVGHRDEGLALFSRLDRVDRTDVGMPHRGRRPRLTHETLLRALVVDERRREELERDEPIQHRIPRQIHHALTAAAKH